MGQYIELLKHFLTLVATIIFSTPVLTVGLVIIIVVCCIMACCAKTLKATLIPAAIATTLAIPTLAAFYIFFKSIVGWSI